MAQGRPLRRHEKYDSYVGMSILEAESKEFYKNSQHFSSRNDFPDPCVTHANSSEDYHYSHQSSPELVVPTQYMSRQDKDRNISGHHMSPGSSKKQFEHSRQGQALSTSEISYHRLQNMTYNQPRPPIASGPPVSSGRPSSAFRSQSTRQQNSRQGTVHVSSEDFPDKPVMRPPSSLSKYQPLPAIGSPAPTMKMDDSSTSHLPNIIKKSPINQQVLQQFKEFEISQPLQHNKMSSNRIKDASKISAKEADLAAWSDSSALSNLTQFKTSTQGNSGITSVEKLVMSHIDKPEAGWKEKTIHSNHFKSKETLHNNIKKNPSDLYDGDDDDSDSTVSPLSNHGSGIYNRPQSATKSLVVIPSVDNPPSREILLAVKLPTDGTRHQKHFHSNEPLQSIVEFAEQIAGIQFNGYVLVVASAPKTVFVDLEDTIENAGLEDKTVFHLEEYDWTD